MLNKYDVSYFMPIHLIVVYSHIRIYSLLYYSYTNANSFYYYVYMYVYRYCHEKNIIAVYGRRVGGNLFEQAPSILKTKVISLDMTNVSNGSNVNTNSTSNKPIRLYRQKGSYIEYTQYLYTFIGHNENVVRGLMV